MLFNISQILLATFIETTLRLIRWKKKVVFSNFLFIHPEYSKEELEKNYISLLKNISKAAAEFLLGNKQYKTLPEAIESYPYKTSKMEFIIQENSKETIKKMKNGGIFLTAHFGNYEAIGPWLCKLGIPLKASYAPLKPKILDNFVKNHLRSIQGKSYGMFIDNPRQILRTLDSKYLFCLVADQDYRKNNAIKEIFLGKDVCCNPIPYFIKKHRPETPIYTCFLEEKNGKKILHAQEIKNLDIYKSFHNILESLMYSQSTSWFGWTHRRFLGAEKQYTIY